MTTATITLSTRQVKILKFIAAALDKDNGGRGYPPTVREIGRAGGISSTSVVASNLERLEGAGYIRRYPGVSRGLVLTDEGKKRAGVADETPHPTPAPSPQAGRGD